MAASNDPTSSPIVSSAQGLPGGGSAEQLLRLAAIDVGSNSIHMIVAQADADGAITTLWRMKEMVGLGRISFPSRRLTAEAMDRAIAVLGRFQRAAIQRQSEKIVTIATSAVREADNGGDFIERARRELKLPVKVVSAREEARLIYLAVRHALDLEEPALIVDIGGGSVEFIVADKHRASLLESRKLGAARMTARYIHSDPVSPEDIKALSRHYARELTPLVESIRSRGPKRVLGTSGTLENIAAMCGGGSGVIERGNFQKLLSALIESDSADRARMRGLDDARSDQIIAGAVLVGELFNRLDLERIELCPAALREGILLDYLNRHLPDMAIRREVPDPRRRSVIDLARRCDWHRAHSEQVAGIALALFDELRPLHGLGDIERELIEYGGLLHDIGLHIGKRGHHKHSEYLILHGDLRNFEPEEVRIIAAVARYHRKSGPRKSHTRFAAMSPQARRVVRVGAAILQLADGLDRSHSGVVRRVRCTLGGKRVKCHILAGADAQLEIWGARQKSDLFHRVFDREITFQIASK